MEIINFKILECGFKLNIRVSKLKDYQYWGTFGYERKIGFYNNPQFNFRLHRLRVNFATYSLWW